MLIMNEDIKSECLLQVVLVWFIFLYLKATVSYRSTKDTLFPEWRRVDERFKQTFCSNNCWVHYESVIQATQLSPEHNKFLTNTRWRD